MIEAFALAAMAAACVLFYRWHMKKLRAQAAEFRAWQERERKPTTADD